MKIIVTGLERSGTRWMTSLLSLLPNVTAVHTSIPEEYWPDTRFPNLSSDHILWMIRYEPFRLLSMNTVDFNDGRPQQFLPPNLYSHALKLARSQHVIFASYEALLSPLGLHYFLSLLKQLDLDPTKFHRHHFNPQDANLKYFP